MDIDSIRQVESLGGMLSRISTIDPAVANWAKQINERTASHVGVSPSGVTDGQAAGGETGKQPSRESPPTGGADGDTGGGDDCNAKQG